MFSTGLQNSLDQIHFENPMKDRMTKNTKETQTGTMDQNDR